MIAASTFQNQELLIREAIDKLDRRSNEIRALVYSNPSREILTLRKAVEEKIAAVGYAQAIPFIEEATLQERKLLSRLRLLRRTSHELLLELIGVDLQIDDLKKELFQLHYPQLNRQKFGELNEAKKQ
jgi:hypothetical protein